ncbi:YeeE/YedE family protein [Lysobacter sp. HDW10]|uniref:YeeE/YedE family protein n=1 Tax=Lysobacter sp. HDW10 TaxID=2714936 RepID=UPI00140C0C26|nr:YeeE/YedE family protein [Lysobacter sp. HDW10]QIK81087.1 YeeE/YedE family protein [Lysobacter sp. HDW10]
MPTLFTPLSAALGGLMIGLAVLVLYFSLGRIAGISGILNKAIEDRDDRLWRWVFLVALMIGAVAMFKVFDLRAGNAVVSMPWLIAAGLLVGAGTRLGNGCTSGHGICGLARFSKRSAVAVAVFMATGMLTVYVLRHALWGGA